MRKVCGIYNLQTKASALKAWVSEDRVHVIVNEKVYQGSETYTLTFSAKELIDLKLNNLRRFLNEE